MHILLTDETNRRPSDTARFFVYGGLFFPIEGLSALHRNISTIRRNAGFKPTDEFKFDTRSRPERVTIEAATEAKKKVIALCEELGCKFIVHVILHKIIAKQDPDQQVQWAANYVIGRYNKYLDEIRDDGICIVDNLPNRGEFKYLSDKFARGLELYTKRTVTLDRIKLFASTCLGASHANSAMDIVLGSFRYCINEPKNLAVASDMLKQVVRLMCGKQIGNQTYVRERGLILRPQISDIAYGPYRSEYERLLDNLRALLIMGT